MRCKNLIMALVIGSTALAQTKTKPEGYDTLRYAGYIKAAYSFGLEHPRYQLYFDSALMIQPHNAFLWQQKGMALFKMKKYEAGLPFLDSAVKYKPTYIDYRAFMKCIFQKNYSGAIIDFREASYIKGNSVVMDHSYDFYIGLCYLQLNKPSIAIDYFAKSVQTSKGRIGSGHYLEYMYWGIALMEMEHYLEAIDKFNISLTFYSHLPEGSYYKARCIEFSKAKEGITPEVTQTVLALYQQGLDDYKAGYTINEDNAIYEAYPYQVPEKHFTRAIKELTVIKK